MSEDLYRGYGKKFVFRKNDLFGIDRNWRSLEESDPDYLIYYDSDNGYFYEAVKIEKSTLGNVLSEYQTRKITYRYLFDSEGTHEQDLMNGYNLPGKFDDQDKLYEVGFLLPFTTVVIVDDSDGPRMFRKRAEPGDQKEDYDRYRINNEPIARLTKAEASFIMDNQINPASTVFDFLSRTGVRIVLYGENIIYPVRNFSITHGEFYNRQCPILQVIENDSELRQGFTFKNATKIDSEGFYQSVRSFDSEYLLLDIETTNTAIETINNYKIRYATQAGDSEIVVTDGFYNKPVDVTYPKTPLHEDSDIVEAVIPGTAPAYHPDHEPWRVFSDSDNNGFKAQLGVDNGIIGINKENDFQGNKTLYLKKATFKNTPAVLAPNRPYNFRIQTFEPNRTPDWQIVHTELGFTGYNFTKVFGDDSEQRCTRVRFVFDACQPNFDPAVNALEVSSIKFDFEERTIQNDKKRRSFFVTQPDTTYKFKLIDSETVTGFFAGAGGGGGGGSYGAGGGGGSTVLLTKLELKPGEYSITVGSGGIGGTGGVTSNSPGGTGATTTLRDETNSRNIIEIFGGTGGDAGYQQPLGTFIDPDFFGTTGAVNVDTTNYQIESTSFNGADGSFLNGVQGINFAINTYNSATDINSLSDMFGSGGAGEQTHTGPTGTAAQNAGRPSPVLDVRNADDNRGGGGGGSIFTSNNASGGGQGGSGYAYITFK